MFGLLNLRKPVGMTSRDAVTSVVRHVGRKQKVGHAGTLDPLAEGVLVVCIGPATRLMPLIHEHLKSYDVEFLFGRKSPTDDLEVDTEPVDIPPTLTAEQVENALPEFTGRIQQVPPIYSAVKVDGRRAYKVARKGVSFELTPREVLVTRLALKEFDLPRVSFEIDCGTGTYIRSIGRDLARRLGTEAVMSKLVRTRIGPFHISTSLDADSLSRERIEQSLVSPLVMLDHLRQVSVTEAQTKALMTGQGLPWPPAMAAPTSLGETLTAVNEHGQLVAIINEKKGRLAPQIVIRTS